MLVQGLTNYDSAETFPGMFPIVYCPSCNRSMPGPFPLTGCACGFSLSGLAGKGTSAFQIKKDSQHRDILSGRGIQLYSKTLNTSFDFYGEANLIDVVDFALTYGEKRSILSSHGGHSTSVIVSYIPDVIGSGIQKASPSGVLQPCSGICLMSPESTSGFAHSFATLDDWVSQKFPGDSSVCKFCRKPTPFGLGVCIECFENNGRKWQNFIDATFTIKLP